MNGQMSTDVKGGRGSEYIICLSVSSLQLVLRVDSYRLMFCTWTAIQRDCPNLQIVGKMHFQRQKGGRSGCSWI